MFWRRNPNRGVPKPYTTWDEYYEKEPPPPQYESWTDYWEDNLVVGPPPGAGLGLTLAVAWRLKWVILGITLLLFAVC